MKTAKSCYANSCRPEAHTKLRTGTCIPFINAWHRRIARVRAILLAGDSAHVNTPIGGMGMNAGVHDAMNLAEKLIALMRGEGDDDLLDRYERQTPARCDRTRASTDDAE